MRARAGPVDSTSSRDGHDLVMDAVRVTSLVVVVAYHWLGLLPELRAGVYSDRPITVVVPSLWPLTWLIDVLPLFLFVGGFVNARSYDASRRRGETDWQWLEHRYRRLLVPALVFIVACTALMLFASGIGAAFGSPLRLLNIRNTAPFGQLWFVGAYLLQVTLVPLTLRAHRRFGLVALGTIITAVAVVDLTAWALGTTSPLLLNVALVWMVPHQLGYFYADLRLQQRPARIWIAIALIALVSLVVVTSLPYYTRDLIDPEKKVLSFQAFTFPLVLQAMWIIAVAMLLRPGLVRILRTSTRIRSGVAAANRSIMTLFLWHTGAFLLAVLALSGVLGVLSPTPTVSWWVVRPLVVVCAALVFVVIFVATSAAGRIWTRQRLTWQESELNPPESPKEAG